MTMNAVMLKIEEQDLNSGLHGVYEHMGAPGSEVVLDLSSVQRVSPGGLRGLEDLAGKAHENGSTVALRGVNVTVYKVLKVAKLTERFRFLT